MLIKSLVFFSFSRITAYEDDQRYQDVFEQKRATVPDEKV